MDIINQVLSAISQLALFTLIPFVWYALCHKKCSGFFQWIGLKRLLEFDRTLLGFIVFTVVAILCNYFNVLYHIILNCKLFFACWIS